MIKKDIIEGIALETYRNHKDTFLPLKERWVDLVDRYENKLRKKSISSNTTAKATLGGAYAIVENAIPRLFSRQPKYRYLARGREDAQAAELYDEFSEYQWNDADCQSKIKKIGRWGLATGLCGWAMGWKEEKKIFKKRTKEILGIEITNRLLAPFVKSKVKDEEEVLSNYTLRVIKPHDMIWSVEAEEIEDCRVIGYKDRASLKRLKQEGYKTEALTSSIKTSDSWKERLAQNDGISIYRVNKILEDIDVEVAKLYLRLLNDSGYYEYYVVDLGCFEDNPTVIRCEENTLDHKFAPIGIFRPVDRLGKFYGFGLIEPVVGILDSEEDTFNMALEALQTDIARPMEYNASNLLSPDSIKYGSRVLIPVKALGQSVNVLPTPVVNMNGVQYINDYLTKAKQNVSAITDFQTGAEQVGGAKTLGEIQIKTQESNARISMILDNFEKQVLEPMGRFALWFNQQFLVDNPKIIYRILGKKGEIIEKNIKFKDVEAIKDVMVISGTTMFASQQAEIQKWSLVLNQAYMEAKMPNPVPIDREILWERLLENGLQVKDSENFLPSLKDREEASVGGKVAQIEDAKNENAQPLTARVLPTDVVEVHLPLHQAEAKARQAELQSLEQQGGQVDQQKMEELQIILQHINDHTTQAGGKVPPHSAGLEVGQGMNENPNNQSPPGAGAGR